MNLYFEFIAKVTREGLEENFSLYLIRFILPFFSIFDILSFTILPYRAHTA